MASSASQSSALDPFDPTWLGRPVRAGMAMVDALQLLGALIGLAMFARARRLPWAHWKGLGGKTRLLLVALLLAAPLQAASDACLLAYAREAEADDEEPSSSSASYSPLLGAYVVLGLFAAAFTSMAFALLTFLALHSRRGLRWAAGLALGAVSFLLLSIEVTYPGLTRHRAGFVAAWFPYLLALSLWTALFLRHRRQRHKGWKGKASFASFASSSSWGGDVALLNDVVAADDTDAEDPTEAGGQQHPQQQPPPPPLVEATLAYQLMYPTMLCLAIALLLLLVGVAVTAPEGRVAVSVLLSAVLRAVWPLHLWLACAAIERDLSSILPLLPEEAPASASSASLLSFEQGRKEEEASGDMDAATVHRTLTELLQTTSARDILINPRDLSLGEPIARGGSGVVRRGRLYGLVPVAAKSLYSQYMMGDLAEAIAEAKILAQLPPHPNVIALYGVCLWPATNTVYLVMELCPDTLENRVLRTLPPLIAYGRALLDAMAFLHAQDVVHRDLKPSNLLLDGKGALKIADMGLAVRASYYEQPQRDGEDGAGTGIGTPLYMAPEIAISSASNTTNKSIDPTRLDVYAAAFVLWFLLFRRHPLGKYAAQGRHELAAKVADGTRPPLDIPSPTIGNNAPIPPALASLLQEMWHPDPRIRPPMAEAARRFREIFAPSGGKGEENGLLSVSVSVDVGGGALPPQPNEKAQQEGVLSVEVGGGGAGAAAYDKAALSPPGESGPNHWEGSVLVGAGEAAEAASAAVGAAAVGKEIEAFGEGEEDEGGGFDSLL